MVARIAVVITIRKSGAAIKSSRAAGAGGEGAETGFGGFRCNAQATKGLKMMDKASKTALVFGGGMFFAQTALGLINGYPSLGFVIALVSGGVFAAYVYQEELKY
ncbi:hypothetical protein IAE28_21800 [Ochrobactrum sp. S45]|nr:hypothetical protein [Ochrobactrum sp. S45]